jgi:hypothetical protein
MQCQEYINISNQITSIQAQITAANTVMAQKELMTQRRRAYDPRQMLIDRALQSYNQTRPRIRAASKQAEEHCTYFDRVVRHMVPERDRLAHTLSLAVPIRSAEGISTLKDLISLRTKDLRVAYQNDFQPIEGCCMHCNQNMER